jgi:hypothetical protein
MIKVAQKIANVRRLSAWELQRAIHANSEAMRICRDQCMSPRLDRREWGNYLESLHGCKRLLREGLLLAEEAERREKFNPVGGLEPQAA